MREKFGKNAVKAENSRRKNRNIVMTALMIVVMSYQATGNLLHEAAGILLLLLFISHNVGNRKWYQNVPKGRYTWYRRTLLVVNILTLIFMVITMGTGIYLSQSFFGSFWGVREAYLIRPVHVAAGAWGMILVSIHGGMHIRLPEKKSIALVIGIIVLTVLGIWAFVLLDMPARITFRDAGAYWRYPGILLFLANAVVMAFFAGIASIAAKSLKKKR